jgi:catechol-2,3-dioxygenase
MKTEHEPSEMIALCHVGMHAKNPAALAEFYRDVMGMQVVGGSDASHPLGLTAFLSGRPNEESHEIAMFANPQFAHYAFKVASLGTLRRFHQKITERGIPVIFQYCHGVSLAFYFQDPEGNMIEVYWPTGLHCPQPQADPIDLTCSETDLLATVKTHALAPSPPP